MPSLSYADLCVLHRDIQVLAASPTAADGVAVFNPPRAQSPPDEVAGLLRRAAAAGSVLLPIAMGVESRSPPGGAEAAQSFDVVEHARGRPAGLALRPAAEAFAREALARLQPTCTKSRLRLFLTHRREDGEDPAAVLDERLSARHNSTFRDLIDIQIGEVAQGKIEEALDEADAVVFIDTPKAGESEWIARELAIALGRHIPIVWVRVGGDVGRQPLPVEPSLAPHCRVGDLVSVSDASTLADEILDVAFRLSQAHIREALETFRAIQDWASARGASVGTLDGRRLIYRVEFPRVESPYPRRAEVHVLQLFGRHATEEDLRELDTWLPELELHTHPPGCRPYDALIILEPAPAPLRTIVESRVVEHGRRYVERLRCESPGSLAGNGPRLLLLGAFPTEPATHQDTIDAVYAIATDWLLRGGSVIMGGHPTFTPLVLEAARLTVGKLAQERLTIYQSRWFATDAQLDSLSLGARVIPTEGRETREASLTLLRQLMLTKDNGDGVIVVGGRTDEGGTHTPGVEEEVRLALAAELPVFFIGSPGGQAAVLADKERAAAHPFSRLRNGLPLVTNNELATTGDFRWAAGAIFHAVSEPMV